MLIWTDCYRSSFLSDPWIAFNAAGDSSLLFKYDNLWQMLRNNHEVDYDGRLASG
jgi:hypothetical protein